MWMWLAGRQSAVFRRCCWSLCGAHRECFHGNTCCWPPQRRLLPLRLLCVLQARLEGIAAELRELLPNLNVGALHGLPGVGGQWGMAGLSNTFTALSTAASMLPAWQQQKTTTPKVRTSLV